MARGPNRDKRKSLAEYAEGEIDRRIAESADDRMVINAANLGINKSIWDEFLESKYLSAGWKHAEWVFDQRDGDFIYLDMAEKQ
jgi:hypothetical protein